MKKLMLVCAVVFAFAISASAQTSSKAEFKFTAEKYDFGKIPQNKPVTTNFEFTNVGEEPLIISEVRPTCGCTVADYIKTPVKKGEKGFVKITFNAAVPGMFTKTIVITSNAKVPTQNLTFTGEVLPAAAPGVGTVGTK
jgi:hypothetical protein